MFSTDSSIPAFLDLDGCLRSYLNHLRHKCSCWKYCGIIVTKMFRLEILRHNCYKNVHVRNIVAQLLQNFRCCGDCGAVLGSISSKICAANPAMSNSIIWEISRGLFDECVETFLDVFTLISVDISHPFKFLG